MMRKITLLAMALIFSMITLSQTAGRRTQGAAPAGDRRLSEPVDPFDKASNYFDAAEQRLDEYITSEWVSDFSRVEFEKRYSASGTLIEITQNLYWQQTNAGAGMYLDALSEKNVFDTQEKDGAPRMKSRYVYHYTPQGHLQKEQFADRTGKLLQAIEYAYDNRGNQISRTIKNRQGVSLAVTRYEYNARGQMTKSETSDSSQAVISSTLYTYDASGNLTRQEVRDQNNSVSSIITSQWRNVQNAWKETRNEMTGPDGRVRLRIVCEYDERTGDLTRKVIENIEGESVQYIHYDYAERPAARRGRS